MMPGRSRRLPTEQPSHSDALQEACLSQAQGTSPCSAFPLHTGVRLVGAGGRPVHRQATLLQVRVPRRGKLAGGRGGG